jgi:hypothetical protein
VVEQPSGPDGLEALLRRELEMPDDRRGISLPRCICCGGTEAVQRPGVRRNSRDVLGNILVNHRRRSPRFLAPANFQAERKSSRQVVACSAYQDRHVAKVALTEDPDQGQTEVRDRSRGVGDNEMSVRSEDSHELRQRRAQI